MSTYMQQVYTEIVGAITDSTLSGLTVSEVLELAQSTVQRDREQGDSTNTALRDAEYYLKARWLISERPDYAQKVIGSGVGIGLTVLYNLLKITFGDVYMRTDPDKPTSEPGGTDWVALGAIDGTMDDGQRVGRPVNPRFLSTFLRAPEYA